MKPRKRNILLLSSLLVLLIIGVVVTFISYSVAPTIPKEWLMGKTKEEVVVKVASVCKRPFDNLIHIGFKDSNDGWNNRYFGSIPDALIDNTIMRSNVWEIDHRTAVFVGTRFWELTFDNNRVVEVKPSGSWG